MLKRVATMRGAVFARHLMRCGETSVQKPALFSDGGGIPCAVKNPDNYEFPFARAVVDSVGMMKCYPQTHT